MRASRRPATSQLVLLLAAVALVSWPSGAKAQPVVDLSLAATITPPGPFAPGDVAQLQFTITNHGPDTAALVSVISTPYPFLDHELFSLVPSEPNPCQMFYDDFIAPPGSGQPSFLVAQVVAGEIGPAESLVCTARIDVSPEATGTFDFDFAVINGEVGTADTDTSNNGASVALQFDAAGSTTVAIPATGKPSVLLLLSALCMIGFLVLRWSQRQGDR